MKLKTPSETTPPDTAQVSLGIGMEARQGSVWDGIHDETTMASQSFSLDVTYNDEGGWEDPDLLDLDVSASENVINEQEEVTPEKHNTGRDEPITFHESKEQMEEGLDEPNLDDALDNLDLEEEPHSEQASARGNDNDSQQEKPVGWGDSEISIDLVVEDVMIPEPSAKNSNMTVTESQGICSAQGDCDAQVLTTVQSHEANNEGWDEPEFDVENSTQGALEEENTMEGDEGAWDDPDLDGLDLFQNDIVKNPNVQHTHAANQDQIQRNKDPTDLFLQKEEAENFTSAWNDSALESLDKDVDQTVDAALDDSAGSAAKDECDADLEDGQAIKHIEETDRIELEESEIEDNETLSPKLQRSVAFAAGLQRETSPHVVDHVPVNVPAFNHRDSTVAIGSTDSGTILNDSIGDELEVMDPDAQDFGPVVDHLPSPHQPRTMYSRTASVITQAQSTDLDGTVELDEQSSASSYRRPLNGIRPAPPPPVVDHVPTEASGPRFKDSILAVASEQSSTIMEDVWREDFDPEEQDYGPVVDNVPTPRLTLLGRATLRNVEAFIEELEDESTEEEKKDCAHVRASVASVADSMDVFAPITEIGDDEENTIDRMALEDDEAETLSQDTPIEEIIEVMEKEPQLVDHVPFRPESRANDASTLGIADPSEGSTVGDLTHEENVYLPVVDHTPPMRPLMPPSTTESVIVAATKSECPDELEYPDAVSGVVSGEEEDDGATLDTRSIGEQINETKVVDHVPNAPGLRRINSEMATTDIQSIISTTSFGLVVDVIPLPIPMPSPRDSIAPLATLSEGDTLQSESIATEADQSRLSRMVDRLPQNSETGSRVGSFMVAKSVVSEDETLDDEQQDGYGPVVSAVPQSRGGGSTHGLLATLSEVDYGTEAATVDGWESVDNDLVESVGDEELTIDQDFDRTPETKNKSVSFRNVSPLFLKPPLTDDTNNDAPFFLGARLSTSLDETKYYEAESMLASECSACMQSTSLDCPCVQRILGAPGNPKAAVISVMSPEGFAVDVDYNKLLQMEVMKRLLLEKEVDRYQALLKTMNEDVDEKSRQHEADLTKLQNLEESKLYITSQFELECEKNMSLRAKFQEKTEEVAKLVDEAVSLNRRDTAASVLAETLVKQIEELRCSRDDDAKIAEMKVRELNTEIKTRTKQFNILQSSFEVLQKQSDKTCEQLNAAQHSIAEYENKECEWSAAECEMRNQLNVSLMNLSESKKLVSEWSSIESTMREQLDAAQISLSNYADKERDWLAHESALKSEVSRLQVFVQEASMYNATAEEMGRKVSSLMKELTDKGTDCNRLNAKLIDVESRFQELEGRNFAQLKESMDLSKQYEAAMAKLSEEMQTLSKLHEDELSSKVAKDQQMESQLISCNHDIEQLKIQNKELHEIISHKQSLLDEREKNEERLCRDAMSEKAKLEGRINLLENEKASLLREIEHSGKRLLEAADTSALDLLTNENRVLEETIVDNHDRLEELQSQLEKLIEERDGSFQTDLQLALVTKENGRLVVAMEQGENRIHALEEELKQTQQNLRNSDANTIESNNSSTSLRPALQRTEEILSQKENEIARKNEELEGLRIKIKEDSCELKTIAEERDSLLILCHDLEKSLELTQGASDDAKLRLNAAEHDISILRDKLEVIIAERDGLLSQCKSWEEKVIASENLYLKLSEKSKSEVSSHLLESARLRDVLERKLLESQNEVLIGRDHQQALVGKIEILQKQLVEQVSFRTQLQMDNDQLLASQKVGSSVDSHKLFDLESRISTLQLEVTKKETIIALLQQEHDASHLSEKESSVKINDLNARCADLETKLATLDNERNDAIEKMKKIQLQTVQLNNDLDSVVLERDDLLLEKELLEEDNEELLVQLGMLKEQLEKFEEEIEILHSHLETKVQQGFADTERIRLTEENIRHFETKLEELASKEHRDSIHLSAQHKEMELVINNLTMDNTEMRRQLENASSVINDRTSELNSLSEENKSLTLRLHQLQSQRDRSFSDNTERTMQQESYIVELEARVHDLSEGCRTQLDNLNQLRTQLKDTETELSERAADETSLLKQQISHLERICAERDSSLQQRDLGLDEMRRQLENLRGDASRSDRQALAEMSVQIDDISGRLQASDHYSNQNLHRVKELESTYATAQFDLNSTLDKLKCTELICSNMVLELESMKDASVLKNEYVERAKELELSYGKAQSDLQAVLDELSSTKITLLKMEQELQVAKEAYAIKAEYENRIHGLQNSLQQRDQQISVLEHDVHDLTSQLSKLESELDIERKQRAKQSASLKEVTKTSDLQNSEMESLRTKLSSTEQKLNAAASRNKREGAAREEIAKIRSSVARKTDRITILEEQLKTLSVELSSSQGHLVSKESELQKLSIALEDLRAEQFATTQRVTAQVLNVTTSKDEAESSENMRTLIVSLSKALENSESERAEAIESLLKERKANTDSLKRLGESVKRFYSTLNSTSMT